MSQRAPLIHLLVPSSWHRAADVSMLLAEANARFTVLDMGCYYTAPPTRIAHPHGWPTGSSATKMLGAFSNKQARPPLCCPGITYYLISRAGFYFYLNSISSSQMQPNLSNSGATLPRLIGCAMLTTVLHPLHNLCFLAYFCTFNLYFTLKVYVFSISCLSPRMV